MRLNFRVDLIRNALLPMAVLALSPLRAEAGLVLSAEAPGVQATTVQGVVTESFDGFPKEITSGPLSTAVGTFSSGLAIVPANQYGGAGGSGEYAAVGVESGTTSTTLTLNGPQSYFGFWWSAADANNTVQFYSGSTLVGTFNSATALGALSASGYYGDPASGFHGQDSTEKFAYLDVNGTDGTTITSVVFGNSGGTGFELDNLSVEADPAASTGQAIPDGITGAVPEPSSVVLTGSALLLGVAATLRSRRKGRSAA